MGAGPEVNALDHRMVRSASAALYGSSALRDQMKRGVPVASDGSGGLREASPYHPYAGSGPREHGPLRQLAASCGGRIWVRREGYRVVRALVKLVVRGVQLRNRRAVRRRAGKVHRQGDTRRRVVNGLKPTAGEHIAPGRRTREKLPFRVVIYAALKEAVREGREPRRRAARVRRRSTAA